ncbi:protein aig1 [Phtheirospermum japonicum]|uniref:Protein aig1 n=1 Tax=Phtheirospermum japonicum TaxID=374723 RepID=A0A830B6M8_9LAMI|nr:protein aig1 [Phtheirospermum japonicum]
MRREIIKCIDGIHAALLVLSTRPRFSQEEEEAIKSLMKFFGNKFSDYMIVIFTGGDDLEAQDETLDDYLGRDDCPEPLQKILEMCGNRCVLFDNRDKRCQEEIATNWSNFLSFVDVVVDNNEGKPYTNELFVEMKASVFFFFFLLVFYCCLQGHCKEDISEFNELFSKTYEQQLQRITEMVESKLKETTRKLELQLAEEHEARLKAEESVQAAQTQSKEIRNLRENLERAKKETAELRNRQNCAIL